MREHLSGWNTHRHNCFADKSDDQHFRQSCDRLAHCRAPSTELPPISRSVGGGWIAAVKAVALGLDLSFHTVEWKHVLRRLGFGSIVEVDDPAGGRRIGAGVEVFAVEVGEEHLGVACIGGNPLLRLSFIEHEAHPEDVAPDVSDSLVLRQSDWDALNPSGGFKKSADATHTEIVGNPRHVLGDGGGVFEVGARRRPGTRLDGPGDGEAVGNHRIEPDLPRIALPDSVRRDQTQAAVRLQQRGRTGINRVAV